MSGIGIQKPGLDSDEAQLDQEYLGVRLEWYIRVDLYSRAAAASLSAEGGLPDALAASPPCSAIISFC